MNNELEQQRIDKWLWASRFFKTRALASTAIKGGKIHINGQKVKPGRQVRINDKLDITKGEIRWSVLVLNLNNYRRPAKEAILLYQETEDSIKQREQASLDKKLTNEQHQPRPSKRDRRLITQFKRKGS
jgi:ribosome-associated heat shock protein Hsp15